GGERIVLPCSQVPRAERTDDYPPFAPSSTASSAKTAARLAPLLPRLAALLLAPAPLLPSAAGSAGASRDLLPDLVTRSPAEIFLQVGKRGKRVVRFSNEVVNVGIGPLGLRPRVGGCNRHGKPRR